MKDDKIELLEQLFMAAHVIDNEGVILWANAFGMNQLGYVPDDFIGHNFSEVREHPGTLFHAENTLSRCVSDWYHPDS